MKLTSNIQKSRQEIRKLIRAKRNNLGNSTHKKAGHELVKMLNQYAKLIGAKQIAIYLTNDGELDTSPLIDWCWKNNIKVVLPVVHPFSKGHLLFLEYTPQTPLTKNQYGIDEPKLNVQKVVQLCQIDIIFTPLVAFDHTGARLGMGGGFYDRTLERWYKYKDSSPLNYSYPVGLAHDCQLVEKIPTEHWDIPVPEIVTPSKHYTF